MKMRTPWEAFPPIPAGIDESATAIALSRGITVRSNWLRKLLTFAMVMGPGLIVMEADNDAGAVSTYTQAGAQYGTRLLWLLLLLLPICYFIQEMVVRLGVATGQGHAAMIYQRFGKWLGRFSLVDLLFLNFLTLATEFAAISLATQGMGIDPRIAVPISAAALVALVITGSYRRWERLTVILCMLDAAWIWLAFRAGGSAGSVVHDTLIPTMPAGGIKPDLVFLVIAIVGTTIAPWQLFFQQSCVADKRLRFKDLNWSRLDTAIGAAFTVIIAGCMMLVGNLLFRQHIAFTDPAQMAGALIPTIGGAAHMGLLLLMVNAAVLGTTAISLSSAWAYGEVMEWPASLELKPNQAPGFYSAYVAFVALAAALVLIPRAPLQLIIVGVQVLAGVVLPSAIIFLQLLLNDHELLGDQYVNKRWNNIINWTIVILLFALSLVLAVQIVAPNLFPAN